MDDGRQFLSAKQKSGTFKKHSRPRFGIGKQKTSNRGGDGDASKPIDTLYRILCPVRKIGSVLGKGGEIVNNLRGQTHAKISVADAIPGAEERVIIIYSYPKQPGEVDADQDLESASEPNEMRPHCPAQDALLKVHDRVVADEYLQAEIDDEVTVRFLVPSNQVGCLLGKGGTIIKKLRSDTGAGIRIMSAEDLPQCAMETDELVQISGVPAVVKKALYVVSTMLHQHPHKVNPPLDELKYVSAYGVRGTGPPMPFPPQGNQGWSHQYPGAPATLPLPLFAGHINESLRYGLREAELKEFSLRILCPTGRIRGLIGKGGANVKELEQLTGTKIQVEDPSQEAEERIINVTSNEVPWDQFSSTIDAVLQLQSRIGEFSEDDIVTTRLLVPAWKVGCLLGQGGSIITEMRRRTTAEIRVCPKDDKPNYASKDEELVQISGEMDVAKEALFEVASRLRARTLGSGITSVEPPALGHFRGRAHSEKMPGMGLPPYAMVGAENSVSYEYSKISGRTNEAQGYRGPRTASYNAGREDPGYPGPPTAPGYRAGQKQDYLSYPGDATPGYNIGQRQEYHGYPGAATATGYNAGKREEGQGFAGPTAAGYDTGLRNEAQGYVNSAGAAYGGELRHEAQGYPSLAATEYTTGSRREAQSYPVPPTGYGDQARHEGQGYPGAQTSSQYGDSSRYEAQGYPGAQTSSQYGGQGYPGAHTSSQYGGQGYPGAQTSSQYGDSSRYEAQGYPGPQNATGYPDVSSSVEVKIPNSAVPYILGVCGRNISDIRQISRARVRLHDPVPGASECLVEIHGSSEQIKRAQRIIQAFMDSRGQELLSFY